VEEIADQVWDEILTGATHNIATSAGRRLRELGAYHITSGTAQAGTIYGITLAAGESATDHIFNRNLLVIPAGTGAGQTRTIVDYNGTSKIAVVDRDWWITPDATSEYTIIPDDTPLVADHGLAQAGGNSTITLRASASSISSTYSDLIVFIMAGTGRGQAKLIGSYVGSTKVATIHGTWTTNPDATSVYCMIASGLGHTVDFASEALAKINTECTDATSDIKAKTDALPSGITKNVALPDFQVYMVLSSDHVTEATGKTITGAISKDGGVSFAALTNAVSEMASGMYKVDITQAEMNADVVTLKFVETDCDQRIITIYTS
ncbi:MAG: hypothetical protein KAS66_01345, partial [Candidatus Omnitrophica bacterium]|nr:hypothetical protein [Candidatus Omnitrophota bacterium]